MSYQNFQKAQSSEKVQYDWGLRNYMISVYKYMSFALMLSAIIAYLVGNVPALTNIFVFSPLGMLFAFTPLIIVIYMSFAGKNMSFTKARNVFWIYSASMGISLASIFLIYTKSSILSVFLVASSMFGVMSIYGYTTKRDLTGLGAFLYMGLIGLIIATVVNIFIMSDAASFVMSVIGVIIFVGLTAYDVQMIKNMYYLKGGGSSAGEDKGAIFAALSLYLDFINIFIYLLRLFGQRK